MSDIPVIKKTNLYLRDNKAEFLITQYEYLCQSYAFVIHDHDGVPIDLSSIKTASYYATKNDGHIIANPCEIIDNRIVYSLTEQTTVCAGIVRGLIQVTTQEGVLRYYGVNFKVQPAPHIRPIESVDEVTILDELIEKVKEMIERGIPQEEIEKIAQEIKDEMHLEEYEKISDVDDKLLLKQDTLTAGTNIKIEENVISAEITEIDTYTKSEIDKKVVDVENKIPTKVSEIENDTGFITEEADFNSSVAKDISQDDIDNWNDKADKATSLEGYGITNAYTKQEIDEQFQVVNPTIDVTVIEGGHKVTVTDIKGSESFDVTNGTDGVSPTISVKQDDENNYILVITDKDGTKDTPNLKGRIGVDGKSAYTIAVDHGYIGTETEWLASLKGTDGDDGVSPVVSTQQTDTGTTITITDKDGDKTVFLYNGKDYVLTINDKTEIANTAVGIIDARNIYAKVTDIPTKVSELANDTGYITEESEFNASVAKNITQQNIDNWNSKSDFDGDYRKLNNKPQLKTVATSGDYNDLDNKPTIPEAYDDTEIKKDISDLKEASTSYIKNTDIKTSISETSTDTEVVSAKVVYDSTVDKLVKPTQDGVADQVLGLNDELKPIWKTLAKSGIPRVVSTETSITIDSNKYYVFGEMTNLTINLASISGTSVVNEYHFIFESGATPTSLSLPETVIGDIEIEANKIYEVSICENLLTYQSWSVSK